MPIGNFPSAFSNAVTILTDSQSSPFGGELRGRRRPRSIMMVEAIGATGHSTPSLTATNLIGFGPLAATESNPFAGAS